MASLSSDVEMASTFLDGGRESVPYDEEEAWSAASAEPSSAMSSYGQAWCWLSGVARSPVDPLPDDEMERRGAASPRSRYASWRDGRELVDAALCLDALMVEDRFKSEARSASRELI